MHARIFNLSQAVMHFVQKRCRNCSTHTTTFGGDKRLLVATTRAAFGQSALRKYQFTYKTSCGRCAVRTDVIRVRRGSCRVVVWPPVPSCIVGQNELGKFLKHIQKAKWCAKSVVTILLEIIMGIQG